MTICKVYNRSLIGIMSEPQVLDHTLKTQYHEHGPFNVMRGILYKTKTHVKCFHLNKN